MKNNYSPTHTFNCPPPPRKMGLAAAFTLALALMATATSLGQVVPCTNQPTFVNGNAYTDPWNVFPGTISTLNAADYHEIDANNGTVVFDGYYYITVPLRLINGLFVFNPGTIMHFSHLSGTNAWVCPQYGMPTGTPSDMNFMEAEDAMIRIDNATFTTADCNQLWGGIYLRGNVTLGTTSNTTIRDAHIGIAMDNLCNQANTNYYDIRDTDFVDNVYGIWDTYKTAITGEGVQFCRFRSTTYPNALNCVYPSGNTEYAREGIRFENSFANFPNIAHNYGQAVFRNNLFEHLAEYGMVGNARNLTIDNSEFTNIGNTAIYIDCDMTTSASIRNCAIEVPDVPYPFSYTVNTISGIRYAPRVNIYQTGITGMGTLPAAVGTQKTVGVWMDNTTNPNGERIDMDENGFSNLQQAVLITNPGARLISHTCIYTNNLEGITLESSATAPVLRTRCNTFRRGTGFGQFMIGINAESGSWLNDLEGYNPGDPCGNMFDLDITNPANYFTVSNWSSNIPFIYRGYGAGSLEDLNTLPYDGFVNFINTTYTPGSTFCTGSGAGIQREAKPMSLALLGQAYPNPAHSLITIPYSLPAEAASAALELRELVTGRTVSRVSLSATTAELALAIEHLPAGCYTYTLLVDGAAVATQKLVIVK